VHDEDAVMTANNDDQDRVVTSHETMLPAQSLVGLWERCVFCAILFTLLSSLIFEERIPQKLLDYVATAMLFSDCNIDASIIAWNRYVFYLI
jgi:hypothetical protein